MNLAVCNFPDTKNFVPSLSFDWQPHPHYHPIQQQIINSYFFYCVHPATPMEGQLCVAILFLYCLYAVWPLCLKPVFSLAAQARSCICYRFLLILLKNTKLFLMVHCPLNSLVLIFSCLFFSSIYMS